MVKVGAYNQAHSLYNQNVKKKDDKPSADKAEKKKADRKSKAGGVEESRESALSEKAKDVLKKLREKYKNMDFMVADYSKGDNAKEILSRGTKDYSAVLSNEELEKMAEDEDYMKEKTDQIDSAMDLGEKMKKKLEESGKAEGVEIARIGIAFNEGGTISYFAELEKTTEKQKEQIEKTREKRAEEKKEAQKKEKEADGVKNKDKVKKPPMPVKKAMVEAATEDELFAKITQIDWSAIQVEQSMASGGKFDISV